MANTDVAKVTKCAEVAKILENNGYNGGELTKKEFDKMFRGTNICSLNWLKQHGFSEDTFSHTRFVLWDREAEPFAKTVRTENFEVTIKNEYANEEIVSVVKYYYTIDLDALRKVATMSKDFITECLTERLEEAQRRVDRLKARIDAL